MTGTGAFASDVSRRLPARPIAASQVAQPPAATLGAVPTLLFGLRLWISVSLALYVAFWLELDNPFWAGTTAAIVCQPRLGASLRKGWFRLIGTVIGAIAAVVLTACFPQDRVLFLVSLALWGALSALVATLLRNFAAYAAALAGYTAAIIATDQLGATGGLNGAAFNLAVTRASEISIGIVCAGVVLAATDFGSARHRLAALFAAISAEIAERFAATLTLSGAELDATRPGRRELIRRVAALAPVIDEAFGESSQLRYHSAVIQRALDGLFTALAAWRVTAVHLALLSADTAARETAPIRQSLSAVLLSAAWLHEPTRWIGDPVGLWRRCEAVVRTLIALPAATPSQRLLTDRAAEAFGGIARALNALALLAAAPTVPVPGRRFRLQVPDWLPSLVNAARAFVTIGLVELFWIGTAWPNGAAAITWAAVAVILFSLRAEQAYATVLGFTAGTAVAVVLAATIEFAVLPRVETFAGLSLAIGVVLVPAGALMARSPQTAAFTAVAANFIPLLAPANPMSYDSLEFYNSALAIFVGVGAAAMSFRLLPPLSPAYRTRRLLALALRDLRRLARGPLPRSADLWQSRAFGRLATLPEGSGLEEGAQLVAALTVGTEIIRLSRIARRLGYGAELGLALDAVARGDPAAGVTELARLDRIFAGRPRNAGGVAAVLRARGAILAISEALNQYAAYFAVGARS